MIGQDGSHLTSSILPDLLHGVLFKEADDNPVSFCCFTCSQQYGLSVRSRCVSRRFSEENPTAEYCAEQEECPLTNMA